MTAGLDFYPIDRIRCVVLFGAIIVVIIGTFGTMSTKPSMQNLNGNDGVEKDFFSLLSFLSFS